MFVLFAKTASASDNELPDSESGKGWFQRKSFFGRQFGGIIKHH